MAIMRKLTMAVEEDALAAGYYTVATYGTGDPGVVPLTSMYRRLTWTEAVDVMLVTFDENRPGMDAEDGKQQQKLW